MRNVTASEVVNFNQLLTQRQTSQTRKQRDLSTLISVFSPACTTISMPPLPGQKGTGKKGRDARQSRSRNSTPILTGTTANSSTSQTDTSETSLLELPRSSFSVCEDVLSSDISLAIPSSRDIEAISEKLQKLSQSLETRGSTFDRGMRLLAEMKKDRSQEDQQERREEERHERQKRDAADDEERGRHKAAKLKKRKDISASREERPLTHGAHGLAPQDGSNLGRC